MRVIGGVCEGIPVSQGEYHAWLMCLCSELQRLIVRGAGYAVVLGYVLM